MGGSNIFLESCWETKLVKAHKICSKTHIKWMLKNNASSLPFSPAYYLNSIHWEGNLFDLVYLSSKMSTMYTYFRSYDKNMYCILDPVAKSISIFKNAEFYLIG